MLPVGGHRNLSREEKRTIHHVHVPSEHVKSKTRAAHRHAKADTPAPFPPSSFSENRRTCVTFLQSKTSQQEFSTPSSPSTLKNRATQTTSFAAAFKTWLALSAQQVKKTVRSLPVFFSLGKQHSTQKQKQKHGLGRVPSHLRETKRTPCCEDKFGGTRSSKD